MKFIISSSALFSRLQSIGRAINSKNTLPILDCFLFEIKDNTLTITASDSETTLVTSVSLVESDSDMRFCINAKTIQDSMKEIAEQPMAFEINPDSKEITASYQNGHFNIVGLAADEYPEMNITQDGMNELIMPASTVLNGINRCLFATADDDLRPVMNGVYFDLQQDSLTFVSTDGHKLVRNRNYNIKGTMPAAFILPKKPSTLLKTLLAKENGDITLRFDEQYAYIEMESSKLMCRLTEGRYPNYNSVIPQNNPYRVTVDRLSLLSALKRVLIFSNQSSALVKLHLESGQLVVSGQDIDYSTSAEEYVTCEYGDTPINIGFKGTFLVDMLNNISGENVIIELADPSRAGVIVPAEQDNGEDLLMLLMPMMLND